ncbi:MAG TPA: hypothetical protein VGK04_11895 [Thermoanaerobaculia bacterium]
MRAAILTFFISTSLFAATIEVQPPAPTSATEVTLRVQEWVSCPPPPKVTHLGTSISVVIDPGPCLSPLVLGTFLLPLGLLEPGDYEVIVNPPERTGYAMFFVFDADTAVFVQSPSIGPTTGGTEVTLFADSVNCFGPDRAICPLPAVTFNGVAATVIEAKFNTGTLAVIAPPNAKGIADVGVSGTRATRRGRVFRYYDPAEAPPSSMFERVLVPVYAFGPGAFGSNWMTEVTVLNSSFYDIEAYRRSGRVKGRSTMTLDFGASRAGGVLFFPPRDFSSQMQFGSLVRDTSRQAEDWGTEVPVVREGEFRRATFSLLNIPVDSRFRQTIRIYNVDSVEDFVPLFVYSMNTSALIAEKSIPLHSANPCKRFQPCASDEPAMATIDLLTTFPEAAGQDRVRIDIVGDSSSRLWAFASVTNNQTQHVTTITPQ